MERRRRVTETAGKKVTIFFTLVFVTCAICLALIVPLVHARLQAIDARLVQINQISDHCDIKTCTSRWWIEPEGQYLILGHILQTHQLFDQKNGQLVLPLNQQNKTRSDSWQQLNVYRVEQGRRYDIVASKPAASRFDYFVGILPRSTDSPGALRIPFITSAASSIIAAVVLLTVMVIMGAFLVSFDHMSAARKQSSADPQAALLSAILCMAVNALSSGLLDPILPDGQLRSQILRAMVPCSAALLVMEPFYRRLHFGNTFLKITIPAILLTLSFAAWPILSRGPYWALTLSILALVGIYHFTSRKHYVSAAFWATSALDAARIAGLLKLSDVPPLYLFNTFGLMAIGIYCGKSGGFATIGMAALAYNRVRRDMELSGIKRILEVKDSAGSTFNVPDLEILLPKLSSFLNAGRVSIAINLPMSRPTTAIFDDRIGKTQLIDDGSVRGLIATRSLLYGEKFIYESYQEVSRKYHLTGNSSLIDSDFFCAVPIKMSQNIIGAIMMTRMPDHIIAKRKRNGESFESEQEKIEAISALLQRSFATIQVNKLSESAAIERRLNDDLKIVLAKSENADSFINGYAKSIADAFGVNVLIHQKRNDVAEMISNITNNESAIKILKESPFNINPNTASVVGPVVVAFVEGTGSYVADVRMIESNLHPKTRKIMSLMQAESLAVVPLQTSEDIYAITLISERGGHRLNPGAVNILSSTAPLFSAALDVIGGKSSVLALGELSSRLIGDAEVRDEIIRAAKSKNLPTTIGKAKASFLLLVDLAGSSSLGHSSEEKAKAYGRFYDSLNRMAQTDLGGTVRKTIGDAVIVTWDGSERDPSEKADFLSNLVSLARYADETAKSIGCSGARTILHHGEYFLGLVGSETFGQIDMIGSGIDEVCKMESNVKGRLIADRPMIFAISKHAADRFKNESLKHQANTRFQYFQDEDSGSKLSIRYGCNLHQGSGGNTNVA
jgi:class 3 adenylate cyclase